MRTTSYKGMRDACARIWIAALALFALLLVPARAEIDGMLCVKLARLGSPQAITMVADCAYGLSGDPDVRFPVGAELTLAASDGSLSLKSGGKTYALGPSAVLTRDATGSFGMQFTAPALSNRFCGNLRFTASGDVVTTVLEIYIEDYLYGVVGYELAPTSGLEALKAQAVVARNYALRQKSARAGAAYDLIDSGDALSYRGYNSAAEYADVLRAVDDTRGQVLCYDGSPATCYFCDSNGGQIESTANALGEALPYSSLRDDPYDYEGSGAKKTASLRKDAEQLAPELTDALLAGAMDQLAVQGLSADAGALHIDSIDAIVAGKARFAEPSRLYASLIFRLTVTGATSEGELRTVQAQAEVPTYGALETWYDLSINDNDNETIWISETDHSFQITFRRSGTGLGMSRRGAQVMAKKGFSCEEILDYYYPGCALSRLDLPDGARAAAADAGAEAIATARLSQKTRLYENADETVAALTTLPAGATVEVFAVQGDWAALGSGGLQGFAHTDALTDFALTGVTAAQVKDETLAKVGAAVDVLQLPVDGANTVGGLSGGDVVRLDGYTNAWARITTQDGTEGYIPRDALTLQAEAASSDGEIVTAPEGTVALLTEDAGLYVNADDSIAPRQTLGQGVYVQILAYNRAWACVRTEDGATGYVKLSGLSAAAPQPAADVSGIETAPAAGTVTKVDGVEYRYVAVEALPMFEEPTSDSAALATLEKGTKVRIGAYNEEWACVRVDGVTGFVLLGGLAEAAPAAEVSDAIEGGEITVVEGECYATVIQPSAPLYPSWDASQEPLTALNAGERVQLGAYNGAWACVRVDGVTGFMRVEALELAAAEAPEADDGVNYLECEAEATARLELYENRDLSGRVVAELNKGARLHVYAFDRTVAFVEYDGVTGFVAIRCLNKVD